jgi:DNA-binding NtrC family response regulator
MGGKATTAQTILIVDDDIGFVWWLGDILNEVGCRVLPALACGEAVLLTRQLGIEPDLIIVNPSLAGAPQMLQFFIHIKPHLKIVTIGASSRAVTASIHVSAILDRPSANEPVIRGQWLEKLRKLTRQAEVVGAG